MAATENSKWANFKASVSNKCHSFSQKLKGKKN